MDSQSIPADAFSATTIANKEGDSLTRAPLFLSYIAPLRSLQMIRTYAAL